jgi:AraC family transcriptional regulator
VLSIALRAGFESHEGFTRAFRRRFRITPSAYRERGFATPVTEVDAKTHARFVADVGPCIGLYHLSTDGNRRRNDVSYTITEKKLAPQPVLIGRRRVDPAGIAPAISEVLPKIFHLAQERGIAISGRPFTRYTDMSMGMMTVEPGMPVAALPPEGVRATDDDIHADMLPAGRAACTIHAGSYDELGQAYSALERWMSEKGVSPAGAPWESYLTDPAEHADPAEWKTEIFWPIR